VGRQRWDEDFYRTEHHAKSVDGFMRAVREAEKLVKKKGWPLETKFNRWYVGFKHGFPNVFGIQWLGARSYAVWFKLRPGVAESITIDGHPMLAVRICGSHGQMQSASIQTNGNRPLRRTMAPRPL